MAWIEGHRGGYRVRYRLNDTLLTENGFTTKEAAEDRAADIESDQRRGRFVDPRLAQTPIDEWIRSWTAAHYVSGITSATYDSHIRNHILPRWSGTPLGDIQRIAVKGWVNNQLRRTLADKSCQDILVLFSMILGEAVDEGKIGANPCRKLRITFAERPERPHATPAEVVAISARMAAAAGLMVITAAYTGMRWGELAGLQWTRVHLDEPDPHLTVDPTDGALHELRGRLELGSPKSAASARTVHLPPFLVDLLAEHHDTQGNARPEAKFVFTGAGGALHRRNNFRRRFWQPALVGNPEHGWKPIQTEMHFHDLRHTHETWLVEDQVPRVLRLQRLGHKRKDIDDFYSHVTPTMRDRMLAGLQRRWMQSGSQGVAQELDPAPEPTSDVA
ncbi:tyrosine-type recombinase/integrase [Actinomycetes bacterium KLBMP 9759]